MCASVGTVCACMFVFIFSVSWECMALILSVMRHREKGNAKHTGCIEPDRFPPQAHRGN